MRSVEQDAVEARLLLKFALRMGARAGVRLAVEWSDIDFDGNLVVLTASEHARGRGPHEDCTGGPGAAQRWHDLRHSFASQLVAERVPLRQVQAWLNHSTVHMSMRNAQLAPDAELISVLDRERRGKGMATH